jgi:hypothetical protein
VYEEQKNPEQSQRTELDPTQVIEMQVLKKMLSENQEHRYGA